MLKLLVLLVLIAVVTSAGCPHALNKRQIRSRNDHNNQNSHNSNNQNSHNSNNQNSHNSNNHDNINQNNNRQSEKDRRTRPVVNPTQPPQNILSSSCDRNNRYQSFDGSCNNLNNPNIGKGHTSFKRYLPAEYDDNISSPRKRSVNGQELPNPRVISRAIFDDNNQFESKYSDLLVYYGQFIAHDMTEFQEIHESNGDLINCPCDSTDKRCLSINIPFNDNHMSQNCINFVRAEGGQSNFGTGYEQTNFLSSFLDATQVYGSSVEISNELRSFVRGQMKTSNGNYMPISDFSCNPRSNLACFLGGESRASENLALTGVHTLYVREHNRIARDLESLNPSWNDEILYQETRKIVTAIIQHITYKEWLPLIIGQKSQLQPLTQGYSNSYNPRVNPAIANEFATSSFRFGHTLVRKNLDRYNLFNRPVGNVDLSTIIFDTTEAYNNLGLGGLESIFMGLISQPTSKFDASIVDTLQNHLFESEDSEGNNIAIDLPAVNINRGRDHGLPGYAKFRNLCSGRNVNNFNDLLDVMNLENINKLRSVYSSVADVDFFVGGLLETPRNALVGPTIACILEKQFTDLKVGDRFYYENGPSPTSFTPDQLNEIRKSSISGLICHNLKPRNIQPNSFLMADSSNNKRVSCQRIPKMNLKKWKI